MAARNDAFVKPCFELLRKKSSYPLISEGTVNQSAWSDTTSKISQLDVAYKESIDKTLQGILELITKAKQGPNRS